MMSQKERDFHRRLLVTFQGEAEERVRSLSAGLIELERAEEVGNQAEVIEQVFREVHSLKGAARSVNLMEIEAVCQSMEDVFAALKRQHISISPPMLDTLHQATEFVTELLPTVQDESARPDRARHAALIRQLKELAKRPARLDDAPTGEQLSARRPTLPAQAARPTSPGAENAKNDVHESTPRPSHASAEERSAPTAETVRIAAARLESLLLQVEELVGAKLSVGQRATELHEAHAPLELWEKRWARLHPLLRTISQALDATNLEEQAALEQARHFNGNAISRADGWLKLKAPLTAMLEFLEWNHIWVEQMEMRLGALAQAANRDQRAIGGMVDHLLQDMKQLLMLPVASILEIFPTACRDLARQQAKEVQLLLRGVELEVDRRILQEIKDPLMHLVRNAIDHGIETPAVRERRHKPRRGTITLTVTQRDSSKFEIEVADDGEGLDLVEVRALAARMGIVAAEKAARMSEQEAYALLFQSGFTTSPIITDISGRGLGLAIVQEKVEKLGGVITVETESTQGTVFRLLLPLTLATLRGLLVRSEGHTLLLPLMHIERVARLRRSDVQSVQNRETIRVAGQAYSLVRLGQALELPMQSIGPSTVNEPTDYLFVVIVGAGDKQIAFSVDAVIGEQEVLMKPLGAQLARVRNIAGATVLGNGQVVPIINALDLIKSAIKIAAAPIPTLLHGESAAGHGLPTNGASNTGASTANKDKRILIVEDSITARMQLKNILELSGYAVTTAVDGLDALMQLRTESFDLVLSDVDMPRLNGLDLTSRIRSDKKLAEMPVVLVTTLASREDQERGIEVGANAYITKSNFDQNKLLDAIHRLI